MCTADALRKLASREARQVCLVQGGRFTAIVTFDAQREELVFRLVAGHGPLSVKALLFQTQPAWVL